MFPQFDPSKMDPKALMEISQLIQQLPPEKLSRLQTLMHNMMAGFDVRKEMEEFERGLPPGFREKLMGLMAQQAGTSYAPSAPSAPSADIEISSESHADMDLHQARLTILKAVADHKMTPEEAERLLFPSP
jgi:hypothetical protein